MVLICMGCDEIVALAGRVDDGKIKQCICISCFRRRTFSAAVAEPPSPAMQAEMPAQNAAEPLARRAPQV